MKKLSAIILISIIITASSLAAASSQTGSESVVEAEAGGQAITTSGQWAAMEMQAMSGGAALSSDKPGAAMTFAFTGAAVSADMYVGKSGGTLSVSVDGAPAATIDAFRNQMNSGTERLLLVNNLTPGAHALRIEILEHRNPGSFGSLVAVDTLRVADAPYGAVSGVVECRYNQGLPVAWAKVTALGAHGESSAITDDQGNFSFSALPPGAYTLRFERPGFITADMPGLVAEPGQNRDLQKVLLDEKPGARPLTFIRRPLGARPVIVRPGDTFPIQVSAPASASQWAASLESPFATAALEIKNAEFHQDTGRWDLSVTVPQAAGSMLYGLRLALNSGDDFQPRAVMVVPEFKDSIRVVHLTDVHVYKSDSLFDTYRQLADEINLINPDVIIVTGDLTDKSGYTDERWPESDQYPAMLDLWNAYNAPTFIVPGNHDLSPYKKDDDYVRWLRFFDTTDFSFDVGPYHFTAFDNAFTMTSTGQSGPFAEDISREQLDWLESDLAQHAGAKMRILAYHVPLHNTGSQVRELAARYDVKLALYGHVHMNVVDKQPPTTYVQTGAAYDGFYRVLNLDNGEPGEMNVKKDGFSAFTVGTVASRARTSEDGRTYTLQVKNTSIMDIPGASWRVAMPASKNYSCDGCAIVSRFEDAQSTLVIFTLDIPAKGVATAVLTAQE